MPYIKVKKGHYLCGPLQQQQQGLYHSVKVVKKLTREFFFFGKSILFHLKTQHLLSMVICLSLFNRRLSNCVRLAKCDSVVTVTEVRAKDISGTSGADFVRTNQELCHGPQVQQTLHIYTKRYVKL